MNRKTVSSLAAIGALVAMGVCAQERAQTPNTYGIIQDSFYRVGFAEFTPYSSTDTYSGTPTIMGGATIVRYSTVINGFFVAVPHLPSGALVTAAELDYCDTNASSNVSLDVWATDFDGQGNTLLGSVDSSNGGNVGCDFNTVSITPFAVDNNVNQLFLLVITGAGDSTTAFAGVILRYHLQVSPAPGVATFGDVPLSDPAFQFIEAFVNAGITVGCGGGNYCPDRNVTRREMAVFFAKALGLQFQ